MSGQRNDGTKDAPATYTTTSGQLARAAGVTVPTITAYAKAGYLDFLIASNGIRLYRAGQDEVVRTIYARRMANRGRPLPV